MGVLPSASEDPSSAPSIFEESKSLTTLFTGEDIGNGNMFNLEAKNNFVSIEQLELHVAFIFSTNIQVYVKDDTYLGFEQDPSAWTLVHEENLASTNGGGQHTPLSPFNEAVIIAPGQTVAFYVTISTGANFLYYSVGTVEGQVFSEDQNLKLYEGKGFLGSMIFGDSQSSPRVWNGSIIYTAMRSTLMPTESSQPSLALKSTYSYAECAAVLESKLRQERNDEGEISWKDQVPWKAWQWLLPSGLWEWES